MVPVLIEAFQKKKKKQLFEIKLLITEVKNSVKVSKDKIE